MAEFLAMGGYGAYVWSAYAIAAVVLGVSALGPRRAERRTLTLLRRQLGEDDA